MKATEKAKDLVNKFLQIYDGRVPQAIQCALICVNEMLAFNLRFFDIEFLKEVKKEISRL